jgi:short-subunit dehydrogenase
MAEVVVITGGTAGVGRAVARRFARQGAKLAILARGRDGLRTTAAELVELGASAALAIPCDVADFDQVTAAAERVELDLGPIDVWINNAVATVFGRVEDLDADEVRRITDVTYHGYVWGTRAALAHMRPRDRGTIVQVSSLQAFRAMPLQAAYAAAKFAIRGFTDALRSELMHDRCNVRLAMVHLPAINTPLYDWCGNRMAFAPMPKPPVYEPEAAAEAIYRVVQQPRRDVLVGWSTIVTVLAEKLAPGLVDRIAAKRGYSAQLLPAEPYRAENLFEPVPGYHEVHGDHALREQRAATRAEVMLGASGVQSIAIAAGVLGMFGLATLLKRALR